MLKYFLLLTFCLISFAVFTYKLTGVPPGINGDEAVIGLNAALISKTGHDAENRFLPLFTSAVNSSDWHQPITVYFSALMFKIFGISYFNLRVTSVIFAILSALIIYLVVKELMGNKIAVISTILFLTTPIVMIQSHLAIENIAPIPFVSLWLLMFVRFTKKRDKKLLFLAGLFLGLSFFSYLGMRMIAPVLWVLTIVYICYLHGIKSRGYLNSLKWFLLGSIPFVLILLFSRLYYPGVILGQFKPYQIENYQALILPYLSTFDPSFLFMKGDSTPYHSTGKHGMFLLATLPLFILGAINIIKKPKPIFVFALVCFFMVPLLFGLGSTVYRASRLLSLIPFYILVASVGIRTIIEIKPKLIRIVLLVSIFLLIGLNFTDFIIDYWYQYPQRVKTEFAKPIHTAYEGLVSAARSNNLHPYVEYYLFKRYPSEDDFFKLVYFPQGIPEWSREKRIPPKSIILTDLNDIPSKEKVNIIRVGWLDYYFIINRDENEI